MTYFKEALSAPSLHFKRLRLAEPLLCNGSTIMRRTYSAIETEILWEGRHFMLYLPLRAESIRDIEELENIARERRRGPLLENHILYQELTLVDSLGGKHSFDIILQELPSGTLLKEAISSYSAEDLRYAVREMKLQLDAIGFCHNNLTPSNTIICDSGKARPLRYWYAKWESYSNNDISQLLEFIERYGNDDIESIFSHLHAKDCEAEYTATTNRHNGIRSLCKGHRYGFVDGDGRPITPFEYSWVSDFAEGRAIVAKNGKIGAINSDGKKVIPVIYKILEFDIETGIFTATNDKYHYIIDYEGKIIRRTKIESEVANATKEEYHIVNF